MKSDFVAHTPPSNDPNQWHNLKEHLTDVAKGTAEFAHRGIWSKDRTFLQPYMINLPARVFDKLQDKEEVKPGLDLWKWTGNYDPIRGFPLEQADRDVLHDPLFLIL